MREITKKNYRMKEVEAHYGMGIEEVLRIKFVEKNQPIETIAQELQLSYVTVIRWLRLAGIRSRKLRF